MKLLQLWPASGSSDIEAGLITYLFFLFVFLCSYSFFPLVPPPVVERFIIIEVWFIIYIIVLIKHCWMAVLSINQAEFDGISDFSLLDNASKRKCLSFFILNFFFFFFPSTHTFPGRSFFFRTKQINISLRGSFW